MTTVSIEQRHIDEGKPCYASRCPAALAIKEKTGKKVGVGLTYIEFPDPKRGIVEAALVPLNLREWITSFDRDNDGKPITFEFEIDRHFKLPLPRQLR